MDAYLAKVNVLDSKNSTKDWYLDFGASNHVIGDYSIFSSLSPSSDIKIISVGGQSHDVTGVGNVEICLPTGGIKKISHVLYSPGITKNLILVGFLVDNGFSLQFMSNKCVIKISEGCYVGSASRNSINVLYKLHRNTLLGCREVQNPTHEAHALNFHDCSKEALWHKRLGHFHHQGLRRMIQSRAVKGLPNMSMSNFSCPFCLAGKQSYKSIPKVKSIESTQPLQLMHSDVANPFCVRSLGGAHFFLTFIDDYSKKTWVIYKSSSIGQI